MNDWIFLFHAIISVAFLKIDKQKSKNEVLRFPDPQSPSKKILANEIIFGLSNDVRIKFFE